MEVTPSSRKRKQTTNPLVGIFTRGKSRRYLHHCNRSGKLRPDPHRKSYQAPLSLSDPTVPTYQKSTYVDDDDDDDDEIYHVPIKDLRARRVFSKPVAINEAQSKAADGECGEGIGKPETCVLDFDLVVRDSDESSGKLVGNHALGNDTSLSVLGKCDSSVDFMDEGSDDRNPNLSEKCDSGVGFRDGGLSGKNPSLLEKCESGVDFKDKGSNDRNPNLLEECELGVDFREGVSNGINPNLSEKRDSGVEFGEGGSNGRNPNLSEKCDSVVDFRDAGSNDGNHNLPVFDKCDGGLNSGNPNSPMELIGGWGAKDVGGRMGSKKEEKFDVGLACSVPVPNDMSPELSSNKDAKGSKSEDGEGLAEEIVQTTPPDAVILIRQSDDQNVLKNRKAVSSSPPKQISPNKDGCAEGKKAFSNSKRNSVLKPCSRPKVFRAPNSFSYRRLLPYLMDIAKDTSSGLKLNPCPKPENDVEEKPLVSSSQECLVDVPKLDEKQVPTALDCTIQEVSNGSKEDKDTDSSALDSGKENLVNEDKVVTLVSNDFPKGRAPHGEHVSSDSLGKLGDVSQAVESDLAALSDMSKPSLEVSPESPSHLSLDTEGECKAAIAEAKTEESPTSVYHSPSKLEAIVSSPAGVGGEAKGILKRNPRGCRGICNCLNCSSFRLNAEKAFEFSRNQLLDAEELALDLMKELSRLRCMLEKSANGTSSHAIVPANEVQEACRKASDLEDSTRNRLSQMNEDLHVHCRTKPLLRPRVNFSNDVKEKVNKNQASKLTKMPRLGV